MQTRVNRGTCKDREIMRKDPHKLVEGCLLAGFAMGAGLPIFTFVVNFTMKRLSSNRPLTKLIKGKIIINDFYLHFRWINWGKIHVELDMSLMFTSIGELVLTFVEKKPPLIEKYRRKTGQTET